MSEKWELEARGNGVFFPGKNVQQCFALCQGENRQENARLVARAVNAHTALVEALRATLPELDQFQLDMREAAYDEDASAVATVIAQARAALALAEEK